MASIINISLGLLVLMVSGALASDSFRLELQPDQLQSVQYVWDGSNERSCLVYHDQTSHGMVSSYFVESIDRTVDPPMVYQISALNGTTGIFMCIHNRHRLISSNMHQFSSPIAKPLHNAADVDQLFDIVNKGCEPTFVDNKLKTLEYVPHEFAERVRRDVQMRLSVIHTPIFELVADVPTISKPKRIVLLEELLGAVSAKTSLASNCAGGCPSGALCCAGACRNLCCYNSAPCCLSFLGLCNCCPTNLTCCNGYCCPFGFCNPATQMCY